MIRDFKGINPEVEDSCYIDAGATVIGDVQLQENTSIWPGAVLRGDENSIKIGKCSNIQDLVCIHADSPCVIGDYVSVGHGAIIHGAKIGNNVLVGMGAIVLDDAVISDNCIVGAGALVTGGKFFEEGSLIIGSPAKAVRKLGEEEIQNIRNNAEIYVHLKDEY